MAARSEDADSIVAPDPPAPASREDLADSPRADGGAAQLLILGPAVALRGDAIHFSIMVENVESLGQAALQLVFDPDVLEFLEARQGPFLGPVGAGAQLAVGEASAPGAVLITVMQGQPTPNDTGRLQPTAARTATGSGLLCVVTLLAKAEGESGVRLTGSQLQNSAGQETRVSLNGARIAVQP